MSSLFEALFVAMLESASLGQFLRPWQVFFKNFRLVQIVTVGDFCQKVVQIFVDIEFIGSGRFHQRVENSIGSGTFRRIGKKPGAATCRKRFNAGLTEIVGDGKASVFQKCFQIFLLVFGIVQSRCQLFIRRWNLDSR